MRLKFISSLPIIIALILIFSSSSWSLLRPDFFRVHDYVHAARIAEMTRSLQDGHFPVRWTQNFGFGYGMPLFQFYAPLPYYFGSFFYWLGIDIVSSVRLLFLTANLGSVLAAYYLGKKLFGRMGGLLTSAAFTLAPYRALNLFVRGAVAESFGMLFYPLILYCLILLIEAKEKSKIKQAWIFLTLSVVGLLLSHNLSSLIFLPFSVVFAGLYLLLKEKSWKKRFFISLEAASSYLFALLLSSFYLIPAFFEKHATKIDSILGGYFDYHLHFLYIRQFFQDRWGYGGSIFGPNDDVSFFLGYGQLLALAFLLVISLRFFFLQIKSKKKFAEKIYLQGIFGGLLLISLFLTLFKSLWLWENLPLISFIQFPWRYLSAAIIFLALLIGLLTRFIKNTVIRFFATAFLLLFILISNFGFFRPEKYLDNFNDFYYTDESLIQRQMSEILPDYIPANLSHEIDPLSEREDFLEKRARCLDNNCDDKISLLVDHAHEILVSTNFPAERKLEFAIADFPGIKTELGGEIVDHQISEDGLVSISVPAGEKQVGVYYGYTNLRLVSDLLSLGAFMVLLYLSSDSLFNIRVDSGSSPE